MSDERDPNAAYSLGRSAEETSRLQGQARELRAASAELLDRVPWGTGYTAIDLGCGPLGILDVLSDRVGADGRVVGVDADPHHVALATEMARARQRRNLEVVLGDARNTGLMAGSFDVVHARTLLVNIPEPAEVVAEMARLARPGGWVLSFEPDCEGTVCYPPHPAYNRLFEIFLTAFSRHGADVRIGRRVAELFRAAGLADVRVDVRADVYPKGHSRRTIRVDLARSLRSQVLALGLAEAPQFDALVAEALAHLDDPNVVVMPCLSFLVSGRKPGLIRSQGT